MLEDCLEHNKNYKPVPPKFNRVGIYYDKPDCWFEINCKAYSYPVREFEYTLSLHEVARLNNRQAEALKEAIVQKVATKEQRALYYRYCDAMAIRETGRNASKHRIQFDKEFN